MKLNQSLELLMEYNLCDWKFRVSPFLHGHPGHAWADCRFRTTLSGPRQSTRLLRMHMHLMMTTHGFQHTSIESVTSNTFIIENSLRSGGCLQNAQCTDFRCQQCTGITQVWSRAVDVYSTDTWNANNFYILIGLINLASLFLTFNTIHWNISDTFWPWVLTWRYTSRVSITFFRGDQQLQGGFPGQHPIWGSKVDFTAQYGSRMYEEDSLHSAATPLPSHYSITSHAGIPAYKVMIWPPPLHSFPHSLLF
jgi:hypothetical protein